MKTISPYQSWHSMVRRCTWIGHKDYQHYGGAGITMDPRWIDYKAFLADMGPRPEGTTLDRRDNAHGYWKENCRWATLSEQAQNQGNYRSNTSGCKGVSWNKAGRKWLVSRMFANSRKTLYWGVDFFEACCAAKSWENRIKGDCK